MKECLTECREAYFPAVICAEYDSPIDALVGLHVPQDEAMDLVAAAWADGRARCVLAQVDGVLVDSKTPIQPVRVHDNASALRISAALRDAGFWVAAIRPPTVPTPRLRVTLTAAHTREQVAALALCLVKLLKETP